MADFHLLDTAGDSMSVSRSGWWLSMKKLFLFGNLARYFVAGILDRFPFPPITLLTSQH